MALVEGVASVIAQECHRVIRRDVFWMCLDKLLCAIPKSRNSLDIFVQSQNETVLLVVILHIAERIVMNIAEQLNAGLHSPIKLKLSKQRVAEEEA